MLGGSGADFPTGMHVVNGETYIVGISGSANYPVTNGSTRNGPNTDIVATKLDAGGNIIYSTYLGGSLTEDSYYSKVVNGELYIFGRTQSTNYPVTNGSTHGGGGYDGFLTKLDASGNIVFSTYLGGSGQEFATAIEVVNGEIHLLLFLQSSTNYPVTNGSTYGGGTGDIAYTKLDASSGNILFSTYLGGNGNESGANKIEVEGGKVYIVGSSSSTNFPVTNGSTNSGGSDIVAVRLDAAGNIEFASYYGGTGGDSGGQFDVENGEIYIAGGVTSTNFPVTDGSTYAGGANDVVYFKINAAGNIVFATYLGGDYQEYPLKLQVINGEGYMAGYTLSSNFPVTNGSSYTGIPNTFYENFYAKYNAAGNRVTSTYLGGVGNDYPADFEVVNGEAHIIGTTAGLTSTYPVTNGSRPRSNFENGVYTKLDAATGKILYSTIFGGTSATNPQYLQVENGLVYVLTDAGLGFPITHGTGYKAGTDMALVVFKLCGTFPALADNVAPASQTVCQNGFTQTLTAPQVAIDGTDMPLLYRSGAPEQQVPIIASYQWQQATSPSGPWTDIAGATQKDYVPGSVSATRYFRRISTSGPCCGNTIVSTSSVASISIGSNASPSINISDVYNTCAGSPVVIGGSPTVTGGTAPYTYAWSNGAAAVANPSVNPSITTIYTLTVTDANGCQQIEQTLVNTYAAYAGADAGFCAGTPVQIGGAPIPGVPGVTYSWAPATGLSCTTCAQPFANPSSPTTYTLTMTLPLSGGGSCQTTDAVVVTPVAAPVTPNFAGPDVTICIGNTATIGTPAEPGFTYTWAPGNYLVTNNSAQVTFQPGSLAMPTPNPITYYVTALKNGCTFVDQMQASVIEARAGVDGCGPRTIGEPDRTPNIGETYTWTRLSGPGNFVGPTNLPVVPVTASVGGATTYRLTVTYNSTTCTDDVVVPDCGCVVDIKVQAPFACPSFGLNNGNVKLIATAADIYSNDPNAFTYTWSPAAGLSSTTGREVTLTDNVQRTYTVTMSSPFDPSFACTRTITVNNPAWSLPVFTAQNVSTCPAVPVQIGAPPVAGYSYEWVGSVLSSTAISNPTATVNGNTQFSVKVTDIGSGCITRDTVLVSLATAAADAGPNKSVCPSGIVTIGTAAQPNTTYSWSPAGADWQNGTNQTSAQPQVLVAVTTVFSVTATNTQSGCTSVDQVTVTAGSSIPAFTLPNITYCPGNGPLTLGGTAPTGNGYTYSWSPAGLVTNATTNATSTRTPPPSTPTTFTLTVRNSAGCEQSATQTITPTNSTPNAGNNQIMCLGGSVSLGSASNPTGAGISYNWTPATGLSSATSPNPTFTPTTAGFYSFTLVKTEGACTSPATVTVIVNSFTMPAIPSVAVCQGACTTIGTTPLPNVQYSWSPTTGLSNPNSATTIACVNTSTTYTLTGVDLNGCIATQQVLVGVNASPAPTINIPSVTACLGSASATFSPVVSPAGSYNYVWSPNNGTLSNIYAANPTVNVTSVGTRIYSLTVTNTATGCSSSQPAQIDVILCCVKPDAGQDISVCPPATTAQLAPATSGGTWAAQSGNPAAATVSASGAVSGMTANGIYRFIYSVSTNGTICTDTVAVSRLQPLSMVVTPGVCLSATNQYSISGTVSLTNVVAGTLTITDGTQSTTLAVSSGSSSLPFSLTGLTSGSGSHTVTATFSGCGSTSATYTAPASCTLAPASLSVVVAAPVCNTATNQYSSTGSVSLSNVVAGTVLTITDNGTTISSQTLTSGQTTASFSVTGISNTTSHTVVATLNGTTSASATYTAPVPCTVNVAISATPGLCQTATNGYTVTGTLSLTNATGGTATITDGATSITVAVGAGATALPYSLSGLTSGTGSHTVTVSYANKTASVTYTAPVSCSVAPCGIAMVVTPSVCQSATNSYVLNGSITTSNVPTSGTLTISSTAFTPRSLTLPAGNASGTFSYSGLVSDGQAYTITASYSNSACSPVSSTYTAPASCSVAPVCALSATATVGLCATATNTYSATVTALLANSPAGTVTVTIPGTTPISQSIAPGTSSVSFIVSGLVSNGLSQTATITLPGCGTTTATFTAPASCSIAPVCSISAITTAGLCASATNTYSATTTVTVLNPPASGTVNITLGGVTIPFTTTANSQNTFTATFNGLVSDGQSHTVVASLPGCGTATSTYTAPASCSVAPVCSISAVATAGLCQTATNTYLSTVVVTVNNPAPGTISITDGLQTQTFSTTASSQNTFTVIFSGLASNGSLHTVTASLPGCSTATTTYTAPASCSITPVCNLSLTAQASVCDPATNLYVLSGTITVTNSPVSQTLTFADGSYIRSLTANAGTSTIAYSYTTLQSDGATHTVTLTSSASVCGAASATYTAPASCSVAPICSLSAVATAGICATATNTYSTTVNVTLVNPVAGVITVTTGTASVTAMIPTTIGQVVFPAIFNGLISDGASHNVVVSLPGCGTTATTYTAPASCTVNVAITATPGVCVPGTNQYSVSGTLSLTNAIGGTATITDGTSTTTVSVSAGATSVPYTLAGLNSGTGSHTVTVSYASKTVSVTYTAPASCTLGVALVITPGVCQSATNSYTLTGTLSLTNAVAGNAVFTDGTSTQTVAVTAGQTSVSFSLTGLSSGTGSHTLVASFNGNTQSQTYTAPASCTVGVAISATPGVCDPLTNQYSVSGTLSLTNAIAGTATITDGINSTTVAVSAGATSVAYSLTGLTSGTGSHTVTMSYVGQTASATYAAPVSCSVNVAITATPGVCVPATNQYSVSGTLSLTNALAGTATITDGVVSNTVAVSAGATSVPYSLTGFNSGTGSHTVTVSYASKTASATYTAPASCLVNVAITASPGVCVPGTNQYSISGTLSLTNATAGIATITNGNSSTTITVNVGDTSIPYILNGLTSDGASHTVTVTYASQTASATYTAPVSCSVAPPCLLSVRVTPGLCDVTTNQYSIIGSISAINAVGNQLVTISDGISSTTVILTGTGPASFTLSALNSDGVVHTVTASAASCGVNSTTYTAPASCTLGLSLSVSPGVCDPQTNQYSVSGTLSLTNAVAGIATISDGATSTTVAVGAGATSVPYSLTGLVSGGGSHTVTVSYANQIVSATYTAPVSCTAVPSLELVKRVDKSKAIVGELITYTLVVTNTSSVSASAITVRDSASIGLSYVVNSAVAPVGTTFSAGSPISLWSIPVLGAGESLSLTFQSRADSTGILYNQATIPGDTVRVCTSVPYRVCAGESFLFELSVPAGRSNYQWYKDGQPIVGATSNVLSVTATGSYSLGANSANGQCPDFSCCPFLIEEDTLPSFQATAVAATCIGNVAQSNGQLVLTGFTAGYTYQYSAGTTFNASASLSGAAQVIPANGVIANNLTNPTVDTFYTVRVYNSAGCYTDETVLLRPTVCGCPVDRCVPFVIQQTKRGKRIGNGG
ncbi:hypothetical protein GCM10028807_48370 [Spirosoma daeguense]